MRRQNCASLRKHVSLLPAALRQEAGDLLLAVALADGNIDRAEVTRVNRYFDALGLDRPELGSRPQAPGGLTPVRTAGAPSNGYAIPQPPPQEKPAAPVTLDPELIRAKLAETEQAATFLAGIFTGENTSSCPCQIRTGMSIAVRSKSHGLRSAIVSSIQPCGPCRQASAYVSVSSCWIAISPTTR